MTPEQFISLLISFWPWAYVKFFLLVLMVFYLIFAAILLRQIDLMSQMVEAQITPALKLIGLIHLGLAVALFLAVLVLL